MNARWKTTVAAIGLLAGLGYAAAQTTGGSTPQSPGAATGQSGSQAPGAPTSPGATGPRSGQQGAQPSTTQAPRAGEGAQNRANQPSEQRGQASPGRAQDAQQDRRGSQTQDRQRDSTPGSAQQQRDRDSTPGSAQQQRDRNGAAAEGRAQTAPSVNLTVEQRSQIRQVFTRGGLADRARVRDVNFNISVGTAVPRTVNLVALPPDIIEVYPAWRGYMFFVVRDEIIVVEPDTLRIVAILPA